MQCLPRWVCQYNLFRRLVTSTLRDRKQIERPRFQILMALFMLMTESSIDRSTRNGANCTIFV